MINEEFGALMQRLSALAFESTSAAFGDEWQRIQVVFRPAPERASAEVTLADETTQPSPRVADFQEIAAELEGLPEGSTPPWREMHFHMTSDGKCNLQFVAPEDNTADSDQ